MGTSNIFDIHPINKSVVYSYKLISANSRILYVSI